MCVFLNINIIAIIYTQLEVFSPEQPNQNSLKDLGIWTSLPFLRMIFSFLNPGNYTVVLNINIRKYPSVVKFITCTPRGSFAVTSSHNDSSVRLTQTLSWILKKAHHFLYSFRLQFLENIAWSQSSNLIL